ncbi:MAG: hypothetical protein HQ541_14730 [Mariniphaga sp.]|nr:hypothetical protein [Mariniphaga sp.]
MFNLIKIEELKPLEMVFPNHLDNLSKMILESNVIQTPIIADTNTGVILDGSHRYVFFRKYGFINVPVKLVDYNDENIRVGSSLIHRHLVDENNIISKKEVIKRGVSGNLFPPRTTRHFFPFRKNEFINIPLKELEKNIPRDVSQFIADVDIQYEINHNRMFIKEIEHEFEELIRYMEEVRQTKMYLLNQIELMETIK